MEAREESNKNSIFMGIVLVLAAAIIGIGGMLWKDFVEYSGGSSKQPGVLSELSDKSPYTPSKDLSNEQH